MTKSKTVLAAATALAIGGFASIAAAAPVGTLADAGSALKVDAGANGMKQNVFFWGHRRWGYWGGPRVYGWYGYGPRRWHHRRHWRRW